MNEASPTPENEKKDLPALADPQLALFDAGAELLTIEEDERKGRYSGAIIDRNKEKIRLIWAALELGIGQNRIAKAFGVSVHTVIELRRRNPALADKYDKALSNRLQDILDLGWERYFDALAQGIIPAAQLPVGLGIAADKKALLDGKPTSIIGHQGTKLTAEQFNDALKHLGVIEVETVRQLPGETEAVASERQTDGKGANVA